MTAVLLLLLLRRQRQRLLVGLVVVAVKAVTAAAAGGVETAAVRVRTGVHTCHGIVMKVVVVMARPVLAGNLGRRRL